MENEMILIKVETKTKGMLKCKEGECIFSDEKDWGICHVPNDERFECYDPKTLTEYIWKIKEVIE